MAEYIEREKLPQKKELDSYLDADFNAGWNACLNNIKNIPAADVRPVVRGKWELEYEPDGKPYCFHCSVCDGDFHYIGITTKYDFCPNCGADMREPPNEES